jgi:hypothetical protein
MHRLFILAFLLPLSGCGGYRECDFVGEDRCDGTVIMACSDENYRDEPFGTDLWARRDCADLGMICVEGSHAISGGAWCTDPAFTCPADLYSACDGSSVFLCTVEGPVYQATCSGDTPACVPRVEIGEPACAYLPEPCVDGQTRCHEDGFVICENGYWTGRQWCYETGLCQEDGNGDAFCVD